MRFGKGYVLHYNHNGEAKTFTSDNYIPEREVSFFVWVYLHIKYLLLHKQRKKVMRKLMRPVMRSVQEVLNLAISLGYYRDAGRDRYMCQALQTMLAHKVITLEEYFNTVAEISNYVGYEGTLHNKLLINNLPEEYEDRLAIYSNWSLRPTLTK